jgi:hypothetical protein
MTEIQNASLIPEGWREVTYEEFFTAMGGPRDIHPSTEKPDITLWKDQRTRCVVGMSRPGWRYPGDPKVYILPVETP